MGQLRSRCCPRRNGLALGLSILVVAGPSCTKERKTDIGGACQTTADCLPGLKCARDETLEHFGIWYRFSGEPECRAGGTSGGGCIGARKSAHREACTKTDDCVSGAECQDRVCVDPALKKAERRAQFEKKHCDKQQFDCLSKGRCTITEDARAPLGFWCVATPESCRASKYCVNGVRYATGPLLRYCRFQNDACVEGQ